MICLATAENPTEFEPYQGNTYTIAFPDSAGTVYGGTLTINEDGSGSVEVTHSMLIKNTATMDNSEEYPGWKNSGIKDLVGQGINNKITGAYSNISPDTGAVASIGANTLGNNDMLLLFTSYFGKTQSEWIALALDVQMIIPLATPITYQLTAQQVISALQGYNAMWADTGDITVTFRGTPVTEPDEQPLQALNLLLGGAYRNNQTQEDVPDDEALDILLGGADR